MDELRLYRSVLATSGELIWALDRAGRWTSLNGTGARRIYGREPAELIGRPFVEVTVPELRERDYAVFRRVMEGQPLADFETRHLRSDGNAVDLAFNAVALRDAQGEVLGIGGTARDISERKRAEAARMLAFHDTLTGLPNRRLLDDRLEQAIQLARRHARILAVLLVDLERFADVNERLGHPAGDAALRIVARRIAVAVRRADSVARHGADEFAVVLTDVRSPADCAEAAARILAALSGTMEIEGRALVLGACIGISVFPADAGEGAVLLRNAEAALARARQAGRNQYAFYGK